MVNEDIAQINHALSLPEFRAFHAFLFQSGLSCTDSFFIKYGAIASDFEAGQDILCFEAVRPMTGVTHYSCVGSETIRLLRVYFDSRFGVGRVPALSDPIFDLSLMRFERALLSASFKLFGYSVPTMSFRKKFRALLLAKTVERHVDYLMGREVNMEDRLSLLKLGQEGWRKMYRDLYPCLSFEGE